MKYKLKKPIKHGEGETITELTFREELCAGDMRGIPIRDPMFFDDVMKLAGRLSGQPDAVIAKLAWPDLMGVLPLVAGFMGAGLETGSLPSQS